MSALTPLDSKLWRDLWRMRGQVLTIALVVACGVASFVTNRSTWASILRLKTEYYERSYFADAFSDLSRAPNHLESRLRDLPGVANVETRIVQRIRIPLASLETPAEGRVVSLPASQPRFNKLHLFRGRLVEPERANEAVLLVTFANAHGINPGDTIPVVLGGAQQEITIVGIAQSPEYVFPLASFGAMPDDKRFAVLWMPEAAVAPAYDMEGAFNSAVFRLQPDAKWPAVRREIDETLDSYGGLGVVPRSRQLSNYFLEQEIKQLDVLARVVPVIFLGVAAFLLNVVLSRMVALQRTQIATLRALGYSRTDVSLHFLKLVSVIVLLGSIIGIGLGAYLGQAMTALYSEYFRFPSPDYWLDLQTSVISVIVSLVAGIVGAIFVVLHVAQLAPAEAMRPEPPPTYKRGLVERLGLRRFIPPAAHMVLRELTRHRMRTFLSTIGIALAVGIMVVARFYLDAIDLMKNLAFEQGMREDVTVAFWRPVDDRAARSIGRLPGVLSTESLRTVPVRFHSGPMFRDGVITGRPQSPELQRIIEWPLRIVPVPEHGIVLTDKLADVLGVTVGDELDVELLEKDGVHKRVMVMGLAAEVQGLQGHMEVGELGRLVGEPNAINMVLLKTDPNEGAALRQRLDEMPMVANVTHRTDLIRQFDAQTGKSVTVMTLIMTLFGVVIAVGIVYNNARVTLSMRARDLASLRVLGFSRREISYILLGELATYVALAIPIGLLIGRGMVEAMMTKMVDAETFRFPVVVSSETYAFATIVTMTAALLSALLVRRKLDKLDLIGVLKTRE